MPYKTLHENAIQATLLFALCHGLSRHPDFDMLLSNTWVLLNGNRFAGDTSANMSFQTVLDQASQVRSQNQHWAHTLRVAGLLIQQLPSARLHPGGAGQFRCVEDLWPLLILPGLGHTVAAVRSMLQLFIVYLTAFVHHTCMTGSMYNIWNLPFFLCFATFFN